MSKPIKFEIKPSKGGQHRVRIRHGLTTFTSEALKNETQSRKTIAKMISEIKKGNFTLENVDLQGDRIKKWYWSDDKQLFVDDTYKQ